MNFNLIILHITIRHDCILILILYINIYSVIFIIIIFYLLNTFGVSSDNLTAVVSVLNTIIIETVNTYTLVEEKGV